MSQKAVTILVFLVAGLLAVVIVVGLAQKTLDTTGTAVVLTSLLTGIVGGVFLRSKNSGDGDKT